MDGAAPPGAASSVAGERVLVLAPHYDDEVLGCGGLLAALAARGAAVRVLFLSDGAGGRERPADAEYAARRRAESERAIAILGLAGAEHLGLVDGHLAAAVPEIVAALRRAVLTLRPDLVLCPSPLEATADHRAAFVALHETFQSAREGDDLFPVAASGLALLYEVNQPARPDLLVDVTRELPLLERAMQAYASQEERHPYWRAGLGLRRFRTLSLAPEVEAAEAYRRLPLLDLRLRSASGWARALGASAEASPLGGGPLVSVIVRTRDRPELLAEALASIERSTYRRLEVVLVNDGGAPPPLPDLRLPLRRVDLDPGRGRAAAANAGLAAATGDYVAFLDDDDLVEAEHYETLVGMVAAAGVRAAYTDAAVGVYEVDATGGDGGWRQVERRLPYSRDFDLERLRLDNYIPFHTLLVERRLAEEAGPLDESLEIFEDWDWILRLADRAPLHHGRRVTCEYRHFRRAGHHALASHGPERSDFASTKARVFAKHRVGEDGRRLASAIDALRAETVLAGEGASAARAEALEERRRRAEREEEFHRARGEAAAARGHVAVLEGEARRLAAEIEARDAGLRRQDAELRRLFEEEKALRAAVAEQGEAIARLHAAAERAQAELDRVERFWPWRLWRRLRR